MVEETKTGKADKTREEILEAARETINEFGLESAGLREIARRAGKFAGHLAYYFKGKPEIVMALLEKELLHESGPKEALEVQYFEELLDGIYSALDFQFRLPGIFGEISYLNRENIPEESFIHPVLSRSYLESALQNLSKAGFLQSGFEADEIANLSSIIRLSVLHSGIRSDTESRIFDIDQIIKRTLNSIILLLLQYSTTKGDKELHDLMAIRK